MEQILEKLLVADSKVVQQGTKELKEAFNNVEALPALFDILVSSARPEIRQTAAVVLRRRFTKKIHWTRLKPQTRTQIKQGILQALINEQEKLVKNCIAQLIGLLGKHEFPQNTWPEILQFIHQMCSSGNVLDKELGMYTLSIMTEISKSSYLEHAAVLAELFTNILNNLHDLSSNLAYYTVITMKNIVSVIGGNQQMINVYHALLPRTLEIIGHFATNDAKKTNDMLDIFDDLVEYAVGAAVPHIRLIVESCLILARQDNVDTSVQIKALGIVGWLIRSKSKLVQKNKLIEPIIDIIMMLMAQRPADEVNEEYFEGDPDQFTSTTIAAQTLDVIAINVPPEKVVPLILSRIEPALLTNDIYAQKAAYLSLAVLAEGCADHIRANYLEAFLKCIYDGIRNPNVVVRNAAFFALGQFSEHLQPEISQYAATLLPVFFDYISQIYGEMDKTKAEPPGLDRMFYALETFSMHLDDGLLPYLPTLMERLLFGLDPNGWSLQLKRVALSTLDSVACAVKNGLVPYFPKIFDILNHYINSDPNAELFELQSYALECLSSIIDNIDGENFKPLAQETLQMAMKILGETDDPDVRKSLYALFAALSNIMKMDVMAVIPKVIEQMLETIKSSEGINVHYDNEDKDEANPYDSSSNEEDEEDLESEDESEDSNCRFTVENAYNDEKEQACLSLTEMSKHLGVAFVPFVKITYPEVYKLLDYPHEDIREAAVYTLEQFCITLHKSPEPDNVPVLQDALLAFIPKCAEMIHVEEEQSIVTACINVYGNLLDELGAAVIAGSGHQEAIINCIVDVLTQKTVCQDQDGGGGDDGGDDEEGESEKTELLLECAGEIIPKFGKAVSDLEFVMYFPNILKLMTIRAKNKKSVSQRSFAYGTLAECMKPLSKYIEKFVQPLMQLWHDGTKDSSDEVRNNSVYGLGEMILHGTTCMFPLYSDILQGLSAMLSTETSMGVVDNISGAVSKMIINNASIIPLAEIFPALLQRLPLKQDFVENESIVKCFMVLYQQGNEVIRSCMSQVIEVVVHIHYKKQANSDEVAAIVADFLRKLNQDFPEELHAVTTKMGPEATQSMHTLLGS